jgi:hypothetical protein
MRGFKVLGMTLLTIVSLMAAACAGDGVAPGDDAAATSTPTVTDTLANNDGDSGNEGSGDTFEEFSATDGNFAVLISDEENAIGDFVNLWVEIDRVGVFSLDTNAWIEMDVPEDTQAVDLTQFTGDDATSLVQSSLPDGEYGQIFVQVEDVEGVLVAGGTVSVKLPSSKLKLNQPFTVGAGEVTSFVFDISVIAAGNEKSGVKYILKPIVGESGPNKTFTRKREQKPDELGVALSRDETGALVTVTDEAGVPVAGAEVELEVKLGKLTTDADGQVTFAVPAGTTEIKIKAEVEQGDGPEREGELHLVVGETGEGDVGDEDDAERLTITVVGELTAGAPLTLLVTNVAGEPVVGADVGVKLEIAAGVTGDDGTLAFVAPEDAVEVEAQARTDSARGDTERGSRGSDDDRPDGSANSDRGDSDDRDGSDNDDRGQSSSDRGEPRDETDLRVRVDGPITAGAEITILVTDINGDPVEGAIVELKTSDSDTTGITGADGTVVMLVPADATQIEIEAKHGDAEGELTVAF